MWGEDLESGGRKICGLSLEGRLGVWRGDSEFAYRERISASVKGGLAPHRHLQVVSGVCPPCSGHSLQSVPSCTLVIKDDETLSCRTVRGAAVPLISACVPDFRRNVGALE